MLSHDHPDSSAYSALTAHSRENGLLHGNSFALRRMPKYHTWHQDDDEDLEDYILGDEDLCQIASDSSALRFTRRLGEDDFSASMSIFTFDSKIVQHQRASGKLSPGRTAREFDYADGEDHVAPCAPLVSRIRRASLGEQSALTPGKSPSMHSAHHRPEVPAKTSTNKTVRLSSIKAEETVNIPSTKAEATGQPTKALSARGKFHRKSVARPTAKVLPSYPLSYQAMHTSIDSSRDDTSTLRDTLAAVMPEDGTHSDKVLAGVTTMLQIYSEVGKKKPEYFWIPFKNAEIDSPDCSTVVVFDEEGMVPECPTDADGYPGWIRFEARTNAVWNEKLWAFALKSATEFANFQAGLLFSLDLCFTLKYEHVEFVEKLIFIMCFSIAQVLGLAIARNRIIFKLQQANNGESENAWFPTSCADWSTKCQSLRAFYIEILLDFLSVPSDIRDAPADFGPGKNHGTVLGFDQKDMVPVVALGVEAQYHYESDRAFLSRIPRIVLHDGVCFVVLLHLGIASVMSKGLGSLTFSWTFATVLSIFQFLEESQRAFRWMRHFRHCRTYREARAEDSCQRLVVRKAAQAKLIEMKNQCPIL